MIDRGSPSAIGDAAEDRVDLVDPAAGGLLRLEQVVLWRHAGDQIAQVLGQHRRHRLLALASLVLPDPEHQPIGIDVSSAQVEDRRVAHAGERADHHERRGMRRLVDLASGNQLL